MNIWNLKSIHLTLLTAIFLPILWQYIKESGYSANINFGQRGNTPAVGSRQANLPWRLQKGSCLKKPEVSTLCDYYIDMELNGFHYKENGQVYFATIYSLGEIPPYSEMGEIDFFDALPDNLTYPILKDYFSIAEKKLHAKQENQSLNK